MRAGRRWRFVSAVIVASASIASCGGNPPDKEIQQAQTAVDAARAASAERYAKEDFSASTDALKSAHTAVDARDYRLALNYALEAKDRADSAAKDAADRKATARSNADRALRDAALALVGVRAKLRSAQAAHQPPRVLNAARKAADDSENRVQEARAAFERADYPHVLEILAAPTARLRESIRALDAGNAPPTKRPR
jgi:Domain of unknown function (DUF4398)